jgi:hypothetical protein
VRSIFYPIFGERVWGWPGPCHRHPGGLRHALRAGDLAGARGEQAAAGIGFVFGIEGLGENVTAAVLLIMGITVLALISVLRGLEGGVKRLSELNMILAGVLLLFVILVGPTLVLVRSSSATSSPMHRDLRAVEPDRARRRRLPAGLDGLLLGVVDQLVALRRHVHRPRQPRPHGARVHHLRAADPDHRLGHLDDDLRRHGDRPDDRAGRRQRGLRLRHRGLRAGAVALRDAVGTAASRRSARRSRSSW